MCLCSAWDMRLMAVVRAHYVRLCSSGGCRLWRSCLLCAALTLLSRRCYPRVTVARLSLHNWAFTVPPHSQLHSSPPPKFETNIFAACYIKFKVCCGTSELIPSVPAYVQCQSQECLEGKSGLKRLRGAQPGVRVAQCNSCRDTRWLSLPLQQRAAAP